MSGAKSILHASVLVLEMMALLRPLAAKAQQVTSSVEDQSGDVNKLASSAKALSDTSQPADLNPFDRPWSSQRKSADDAESSDSLLIEMDRKWAITSAAYSFTATPDFYSPAHNALNSADWNSSLSGAFATYLNHGGTTSLRMTGDLEIYGQRRDAGMAGNAGAQDFTMEWEISHVVPSRFGSLEVAAGWYQQQLVSYPAFANGPLTDVLLGYSASSVGFETTVTVPDKNISLSFRYGTERVGSTPDKSRAALFEFSWTW